MKERVKPAKDGYEEIFKSRHIDLAEKNQMTDSGGESFRFKLGDYVDYQLSTTPWRRSTKEETRFMLAANIRAARRLLRKRRHSKYSEITVHAGIFQVCVTDSGISRVSC